MMDRKDRIWQAQTMISKNRYGQMKPQSVSNAS